MDSVTWKKPSFTSTSHIDSFSVFLDYGRSSPDQLPAGEEDLSCQVRVKHEPAGFSMLLHITKKLIFQEVHYHCIRYIHCSVAAHSSGKRFHVHLDHKSGVR